MHSSVEQVTDAYHHFTANWYFLTVSIAVFS